MGMAGFGDSIVPFLVALPSPSVKARLLAVVAVAAAAGAVHQSYVLEAGKERAGLPCSHRTDDLLVEDSYKEIEIGLEGSTSSLDCSHLAGTWSKPSDKSVGVPRFT